jgi:hypothetical protein
LEKISNAMSVIDKVDNGDGRRINGGVAHDQWQCALRNTAATKHKQTTGDLGS